MANYTCAGPIRRFSYEKRPPIQARRPVDVPLFPTLCANAFLNASRRSIALLAEQLQEKQENVDKIEI